MTGQHHDHSSLLSFLAYLSADKRQRRQLLALQLGIPLFVCLVVFIVIFSARPYHRVHKNMDSAYAIRSFNSVYYWDLNWEELESQLSQQLQVEFTHLQTPEEEKKGIIKLSQDGETVTLVLSTFTESHIYSSYSAGYNSYSQWLGAVAGIDLYMEGLSYQQRDAYPRCLAGILNPGSENRILGELNPPQTRSRQVDAGNVSYYYTGVDLDQIYISAISPEK